MLSDNIKAIRKNRGFTQEDLATRLHVTRQTISKWEKGYSVPDADLLSRMAEVFEVPVTELLGEPSQPASDPDPVVEQLARLNEQLAVRNRRASRIWRIVGITLGGIVLLFLLTVVLGILFSVTPSEEVAGSIQWECTVDGQIYSCGVEYTESYRVVSGYTQVDLEAISDIPDFRDARQAQGALYERVESLGGTVEVVRQEGLPLPAPAAP